MLITSPIMKKISNLTERTSGRFIYSHSLASPVSFNTLSPLTNEDTHLSKKHIQ